MMERESQWQWMGNGERIVRSIARTGPGCHEGCGVLLHVNNGKLVKVEGDPDFPLNQGRLCPRCSVLPEVVYHPDRLKYPLQRVGERGEGKWKRITWDEAYEIITKELNDIKKRFGPESVIFCSGTERNVESYLLRLCYSFGSPNRLSFGPLDGHACYLPKIATMAALFGNFAVMDCAQTHPDRYINPAWEVPKCIIIWGNEPTISSSDGFMGYWIIECIKRGSGLIVIDPRKTRLAADAKIWLQIRPGTDAALALGMLNVIINEGLYDAEFVQKWTYGFDELKKRVQEYPVEKVADITWIPADKIIEAARMYATSKPAAVQWGVAVDQSKECITTLHAIVALWTITGNMDVPGGNIIRGQLFNINQLRQWGAELISEEQKEKRIGLGKYPFCDWAKLPPGQVVIDQILSGQPYPIKAAWIQSTNPITCGAADSGKVYKAFKNLDFNVVVDLFMTPTAMAVADVILPAATYAERDGIAIPVGNITCIGTINKAIEPVGECKSDMEINLQLGKRLNPEAWPWDNVQEMFNAMLASTSVGMTFEELREEGFAYDTFEYKKYEKGLLRPDKQAGFNTLTGKVELYSKVFQKCGLDALPYFEEPPESPVSTPEIAQEYPLILTTGARTRCFFHSEHRQIPSLRRMNPNPVTEIHPETAEKLGIKDGAWIYIENKYGKCRQKAKLTDNIHPKVIHSQHGWWFPEKSGPEPSLFGVWESNINLLLPSGWEGSSGLGYPFKNQMCRVYKASTS